MPDPITQSRQPNPSTKPPAAILLPPVPAPDTVSGRIVDPQNWNKFQDAWFSSGKQYTKSAYLNTIEESKKDDKKYWLVGNSHIIIGGAVYEYSASSFDSQLKKDNSVTLEIPAKGKTHFIEFSLDNKGKFIPGEPRTISKPTAEPAKNPGELRIPDAPPTTYWKGVEDKGWSPDPGPDFKGRKDLPKLPEMPIQKNLAGTRVSMITSGIGTLGLDTGLGIHTISSGDELEIDGVKVTNVEGKLIQYQGLSIFADNSKSVPIGGGMRKHYFEHPKTKEIYSVTIGGKDLRFDKEPGVKFDK